MGPSETSKQQIMTREGFWLFAYGSLMARPRLPWRGRMEATMPGWTRRFWQGSHDHRGRPGAPGRVLTLVPEPDRGAPPCVGFLYFLPPAVARGALTRLDYREKNGYVRTFHPVIDRFGTPREALVYLAGPGNPAWLGPAPLSDLAAQICAAEGPSGTNTAYLFDLHRTLARLGLEDPHVSDLVGAVRARLNPA
ncbi:MAG: gamma-glutamylcyclotransferase [Proteobacteria bacterium]|nr:gamma-glutamylcyclotransferase [Pseudomonadota bacterium]